MTVTDNELSLGAFFGAVPSMPGGNTPWAARYGMELREILVRQASRQPRNLQVHLGPSELGSSCDRQVVSKMTAQKATNHVMDPWPSVVGTAVHAWLAEAFARENILDGVPRWIPEQRVTPVAGHPGTADLYDAAEEAVVDHKILGPTSIAKVKSAGGPGRKYVVQLLLYAMGYRNLGFPVRRVVLAAWPRAAPTLDSMYCWERPYTPDDDLLVSQVLAETDLRAALARRVLARQIRIEDVPVEPGPDCSFCPVFRPQSAKDGGPGCPGHSPPY